MEYLLAQTNRGDLLTPEQTPDIPPQVLEEDEDEPDATVFMPGDLEAGDPWNDAEPEATLCQPTVLGAGDPPSAVDDQVLLEGDTEPRPFDTEVNNTFFNTLLKNTILMN